MTIKQKKNYSGVFIEDYIKNRGRSDLSITAELLDESYLEQVYEEMKDDAKEFVFNPLSKEDKATILSELVRNINPHATVEDYERIKSTTKTINQSFGVMEEFGPTAYFFLPVEQQQNKEVILNYLEGAKGLMNHDPEEFATYNKIPFDIFNDLEFLEKVIVTNIDLLAGAPKGSKCNEVHEICKRNENPAKYLETLKLCKSLEESLTIKPRDKKPTAKMKI